MHSASLQLDELRGERLEPNQIVPKYPTRHGIPCNIVSCSAQHPTPLGMVSHPARYRTWHSIPHGTVSHGTVSGTAWLRSQRGHGGGVVRAIMEWWHGEALVCRVLVELLQQQCSVGEYTPVSFAEQVQRWHAHSLQQWHARSVQCGRASRRAHSVCTVSTAVRSTDCLVKLSCRMECTAEQHAGRNMRGAARASSCARIALRVAYCILHIALCILHFASPPRALRMAEQPNGLFSTQAQHSAGD